MNRISFVMTGRNDDYGGNFLNRMTNSVRTLLYLAEKYKANFELIIIDYNPPIDKPTLKEALGLKGNTYLAIRVITIPHDFHLQVSNDGKNPFPEYIAKNIGIRRANADFIISTNPDIIFSDEFIKFLTQTDLNRNKFYRANRHDLDINIIDGDLPIPQVLSTCRKHSARIWTNNGSPYISWSRWFKRFRRKPKPYNLFQAPVFNFITYWKIRLNPNRIHDAAAGDFLMLHRDQWAKTRAYDQIPFLSYVDGYQIHRLPCFGLNQEIIPYPIYHPEHQSSNAKRPMLDVEAYKTAVSEMARTNKAYKEYSENWGYPEITFSETTI